MEVAGVRPPLRAEDIGFRLGPRLNAAGRLTTAEKALRLLLTTDENEATELAAQLDLQNRERQAVEKEICAAAEEQVSSVVRSATRRRHRGRGARTGIPACSALWPRGWRGNIIGPRIVIGFDDERIREREADAASKGSRLSRRWAVAGSGWRNSAATKWRPA